MPREVDVLLIFRSHGKGQGQTAGPCTNLKSLLLDRYKILNSVARLRSNYWFSLQHCPVNYEPFA